MMFSRKPIRRPVVCKDGFEMSVQASENHYCSPRQDDGPWISVEVGFPSEKVNILMPYVENADTDDPTEEVYPYVPSEVVVAIIMSHGGQTGGELPDLKMVFAPRPDASEPEDDGINARFAMLEFD